MKKISKSIGIIAILALTLAGFTARAQTYPAKPVTMVVPFAAGGATDLIARVMARAIEKSAGQNFVVENVGGGGSTIGTAKVAGSQADGYTLLFGSSSALVIAPHLYKNLKYNTFTSFEPIVKIASAPYVLVTKAGSPLDSYEKLVAYAKANPAKVNFGSPGEGSSLHLTIELMKDGSKFFATHIPFRGSAFAWNALLAGDVDFIIDTPSAAVNMVKTGKAQALAVTSLNRISELPQVRTLNEIGLKDFESQAWFALLAPKGTSPATVNYLKQIVSKALGEQEVVAAMTNSGFIPATQDSKSLPDELKREHEKWGRIIATRKIQLQ